MKRVLRQTAEGISFLELLLDETICEGDILTKELILLAGGRKIGFRRKKSMSFYFGLHRERHLI